MPPLLELGQRVLGSSHGLGILAMGQIMPGAAGAVAHPRARTVHRGGADAPSLAPEEIGEIGHRPRRHRITVVQGRLVQHGLQQRASGGIRLRWPPRTVAIGSPRPALGQEALSPAAQAVPSAAEDRGRVGQRYPPPATSTSPSARWRTRGSGSVRVKRRDVARCGARSAIAVLLMPGYCWLDQACCQAAYGTPLGKSLWSGRGPEKPLVAAAVLLRQRYCAAGHV